uniref:Solute carrier family 2, facilitated glucose transporter member 8 n=2 Tax=Eptatretus burgeri TaxID=7764 RepID=A0A8C4QT98_EPTBU
MIPGLVHGPVKVFRMIYPHEPDVREGSDGEEELLLCRKTNDDLETYYKTVNSCGLYWATLASVLGSFSFGLVLGYSSPVLPQLQAESNSAIHLDSTQASWFGSLVTVGAMAGALFGGILLGLFGRKTCLLTCVPLFVLGQLVVCGATAPAMLYTGRLVLGIATGCSSVTVPVYLSEVAHPAVRGILGSCMQLMVVTGIFSAFLLGGWLNWRWLAIASAVPPTLQFMMLLFAAPESPRWLLAAGREMEALRALQYLRGMNASVELEVRALQRALTGERSMSVMEVMRGGLMRPLSLGVIVMVLQQATGVNAILFYAQNIFEKAKVTPPTLGPLLVAAVQVLATGLAVSLADRAGRKTLLVLSGLTMAISLVIFGGYFHLQPAGHPANATSGLAAPPGTASDLGHGSFTWLALCCMMTYIVGFSLGWGPLPWVIMVELAPNAARGVVGAVGTLSNWLMAFLITKEFADLMHALGEDGVFWLFAGACVAGLIFAAVVLPETKGQSLEQIQARMGSKKPQ